MVSNKTIAKLLLAGGVLISLGFTGFVLGEYLARRSGDPDGFPSLLGFLVMIVFVSVGLPMAGTAIVYWVFGWDKT